jgi:hypothetical protein
MSNNNDILGPLNKGFQYSQQLYMNRVKVRSYAKEIYNNEFFLLTHFKIKPDCGLLGPQHVAYCIRILLYYKCFV